mgnify:FL=1
MKMRISNRARGGVLRMLAACGVLMTPACVLAVPAILEQLPDNAAIVVTMPNPKQTNAAIMALATSSQLPLPPMSMTDLLLMTGIMGGVSEDKAWALVVLAPEDAQSKFDPSTGEGVLALLPTSNYAELIQNFGGTPGPGVDETEAPSGEKIYTKDLKNGYAAIAQNKGTLERYKAGKADSITSRAGEAGSKLVDSSDLALIVNFDVLRPHMDETMRAAKEAAKEAAKARLGSVPGAEVDEVEFEASIESPAGKWIGERLSQDARMSVTGLKVSELGLRMDGLMAFTPGSYMAKAFQGKANAGELFKKLPAEPYLIAYAMDTSAPAFKQMVRDVAAKAAESKVGDDERMPSIPWPSLAENDGQAMLMGFNPGMLMGSGVFSSTIMFTKSSDPAKSVQAWQESLSKLNGFENEQLSFVTKYTQNGATLGGEKRPMDVWEARMTLKEPSPEQAQQMSMLFGPAGVPGGYILKTEDGFYQTFAKNSALMGKAVAAGEANLGGDAMIKQVGDLLPKNRMMEGYLGAKTIVDNVVPMLGMMGLQVDPESLPQQIPPVAVCIAGQDGAAQFTAFVPSPVLKTGAMLFSKVQEARTNMEQMMDENESTDNAGDGDKPSSGQPKF